MGLGSHTRVSEVPDKIGGGGFFNKNIYVSLLEEDLFSDFSMGNIHRVIGSTDPSIIGDGSREEPCMFLWMLEGRL